VNPVERFRAALHLEETDRAPVVIPTNSGVEDLMKASKSFWPEAQVEAEKMVQLALAAHKVAGVESVTLPFDKFVEVEAMGAELDGWGRARQPNAIPLIDNPEHLERVRDPDPRKDGRMPAVIEAVEMLKDRVGGEVPIIATVASPFEISSTLWNPNTLVLYFEYDKEPLKKLLDMSASLLSSYARLLFKAGADAISIIDGNSQNLFGVPMVMDYGFDGVEPGAEGYEEFSGEYVKKLVDSLGGDFILHICGDTVPILDHMVETGAVGLSIDRVRVKAAKEIAGNEVSIVGNVSVETLWKETPGTILREARAALDEGVDVLAPGCNLIPATPLENIKALVKAAKTV
jgi:[methyl-Co(III) methanol-specific corrinoid protein]:coenzyme M methyltransferase